MHHSSSGLGHRPFTAKIRGSNPLWCTNNGWRAEQVTASDCKSDALWHTGFESLATHHIEAHYGIGPEITSYSAVTGYRSRPKPVV